MRFAALLLTLFGLTAGAESVSISAVEKAPTSPPPSVEEEGYGFFGAQLDAGVPHGVGGSLVLRPVAPLRLQLGAVHNGLSAGARAGVAFVPFQSFIRPSLVVEAGMIPRGDGRVLRALIGPVAIDPELLGAISYRFASARLGLELGSSRAFSVQLQGGVSYLDGSISSLSGRGYSIGGAKLQLLIPSVTLGTTLFFG